ncbi:hypothetical protein Calhy_0771 [Caldicellulosiruptor hydrothermalis 108]|uniref:YqzN/YkzM domain-containing protein n=1 Tax=Caldicellulosiruptor hydrothermalis (strain DSM 18901 / VKM B-2411 / 108) TaxID=632292 RepID=E4QE14_CALH1|nr:hypothetical protein [Caldicellulosiruptor hydrothermalis]ADQ06508.1 hypothetical protein Calhy_0771 [Caldicellulosiruptor hydrothermalis 108]
MPKEKETINDALVQQEQALYNKDELISAAHIFCVKPEVVVGALKLINKDMLTKSEAEKAIKTFLERKV